MCVCVRACVCVCTGAISAVGDVFSQNARATRLSKLSCTGSEKNISECTSSTQEACSLSHAAVAVCQGKIITHHMTPFVMQYNFVRHM